MQIIRLGLVLAAAVACASMAPAGELLVADRNESVRVFDRQADGNAAPARLVRGSNTLFGLQTPCGIARDDHYIYASVHTQATAGIIAVFSLAADGDAPPVRVIRGAALARTAGVAVDDTELFVANSAPSSIAIFDKRADGETPPLRVISGNQTQLDAPDGLAIDDRHIYVANSFGAQVLVFNKTDQGNVAPVRVIAGDRTGLDYPWGIALNNDAIFVTDFGATGCVRVFDKEASGNVAPIRSLIGPATLLWGPKGVAADDTELFVGGLAGVRVFAAQADGNVAPVRSIQGTATGLKWAEALALSSGGRSAPERPHAARPLDFWRWRNPRPTSQSLQDVAYGNGVYIAVGWQGTLVTAPDGRCWSVAASGTSNTLTSAAFGQGLLVIGGAHGTLRTSPDGVHWTARTSGTARTISDLVFAEDRFVGVGTAGTILTSPDGVNWQARSLAPVNLDAVAYGGGRYVAVGWSGTNGVILTSADGATNWTRVTVPGAELATWGVAYGAGRFVCAGYDQIASAGVILTSTNGLDWAVVTITNVNLARTILRGAGYGGGEFVVVGGSGDDVILTSPDGLNWRERSPGLAPEELNRVRYCAGGFLAVGYGGAIERSADGGECWTLVAPGPRDHFQGVAFGNNRFVAVGPAAFRMVSANGAAWTPAAQELAADLYDITFAAGSFVAVGGRGTIVTSTNAAQWTTRISGVNNGLISVIHGGGQFLAGGMGCLLTSPDGVNWTTRQAEFDKVYKDAAWGNGLYVVCGYDLFGEGFILTSPAGINWTTQAEAMPESWESVAFGHGRFVMLGNRKSALTSANGADWEYAAELPDYPARVRFIDGRFVAVGDSSIISSTNGADWVTHQRDIQTGLKSVAGGRGAWVAVGPHGKILQAGLHTPNDYDGDGVSDLAVYCLATGEWYVRRSADYQMTAAAWLPQMCPVPGDYDGDGRADYATWLAGNWYVAPSSDPGHPWVVNWGAGSMPPAAADYDGDGITDLAVYRPMDGIWYILQSADGRMRLEQWGFAGTTPVPGDYDGDGRADLAVYHPAAGRWYVLYSSGGGRLAAWGWDATLPARGDYDGDGREDRTVILDGWQWYITPSSQDNLPPPFTPNPFRYPAPYPFGWLGVVPVTPGDYDGDGTADLAVYWPPAGIWYIRRSSDGQYLDGGAIQFGWSDAAPVQW